MELTWSKLLTFELDNEKAKKSIEKIVEESIFPDDFILCKTTNYYTDYSEISPPTNAYDRDIPNYIHLKFVEAFNRKGFKANRNNSIYFYPNVFDTVYGNEYYIFIPYVINPFYFTVGIWCRDLYLERKEYYEWKEIFPNLKLERQYLEDGENSMLNINDFENIFIESNEIKKMFSEINADAFIEVFKYKNEQTATIKDLEEAQFNRSEIFFNCRGLLINLDELEDHFSTEQFSNLKKVNIDKEMQYGEGWEEYEDDEEFDDE